MLSGRAYNKITVLSFTKIHAICSFEELNKNISEYKQFYAIVRPSKMKTPTKHQQCHKANKLFSIQLTIIVLYLG